MYTTQMGLPFLDRARQIVNRNLVIRFSTGAYERKTFISLPFGNYWSNFNLYHKVFEMHLQYGYTLEAIHSLWVQIMVDPFNMGIL